jgi:GNAT superfamily N-acetyltransferase
VAISHLFASAVVAAAAPGRLWVDDLEQPRVAHAVHGYGMSLVWGPGPVGTGHPLVAHLRDGTYRDRDEWLQLDPRLAEHADAVVPAGAERQTRVNLQFDEPAYRAQPVPVLPAGWLLRPMVAEDLLLPDTGVVPRDFWGTAEEFLAAGGGVCATRSGEVGAMAFTSFRVGRQLELGVQTRPEVRGLGLARAAAAALVEACLAQGLEPVWTCRKSNTASLGLAQRLGFRTTREVPYYRLAAGS